MSCKLLFLCTTSNRILREANFSGLNPMRMLILLAGMALQNLVRFIMCIRHLRSIVKLIGIIIIWTVFLGSIFEFSARLLHVNTSRMDAIHLQIVFCYFLLCLSQLHIQFLLLFINTTSILMMLHTLNIIFSFSPQPRVHVIRF